MLWFVFSVSSLRWPSWTTVTLCSWKLRFLELGWCVALNCVCAPLTTAYSAVCHRVLNIRTLDCPFRAIIWGRAVTWVPAEKWGRLEVQCGAMISLNRNDKEDFNDCYDERCWEILAYFTICVFWKSTESFYNELWVFNIRGLVLSWCMKRLNSWLFAYTECWVMCVEWSDLISVCFVTGWVGAWESEVLCIRVMNYVGFFQHFSLLFKEIFPLLLNTNLWCWNMCERCCFETGISQIKYSVYPFK